MDEKSGTAIEIVDHDARWSRLFASERDRITPALAPWLDGPVEHVGSTAVPGLAAKPIIDMLAPVADHGDASAAVAPLERLGYIHWADDPFRSWRHWFLTPSVSRRTHHLYLIEGGSEEAEALIAFRDHLRTNPDDAASYGRLKRTLVMRYAGDRDAYTEAKAPFVRAMFEKMGRPYLSRR